MSRNILPVSISIMGKKYKIACAEEEQEKLLASARQLDQQMRSIKGAGRVTGSERIAVLAALNMASELMSDEQSHDKSSSVLSEQLNKIRLKIESALENP